MGRLHPNSASNFLIQQTTTGTVDNHLHLSSCSHNIYSRGDEAMLGRTQSRGAYKESTTLTTRCVVASSDHNNAR